MRCSSFYQEVAFTICSLFLFSLSVAAQKSVSHGQPVTLLDSTREQDGLSGSVRRVKIENASLQDKEGKVEEGPRQLLEVTTYGLNGNRVENVSYPVRSGPAGKEEYRYDDNGNIIEMTLRGTDGSIINREAYDYEFDRFGNWRKMVTSLVVFEGGELKTEPVEVTYRTFTYYFDDAVASVIDSGAPSALPKIPLLGSSRSVGTDIPVGGPFLLAIERQTAVVDANTAPLMVPAAASEISLEEGLPRRGKRGIELEDEEDRSEGLGAVEPSVDSSVETTVPTSTPIAATTPPGENNATGPYAAFALYKAGRASHGAGDTKGAVKAYLESLKLEPDSAQVNLSLGNAYITLKKPYDAIKAFKRAVALDPDLAEAHYGLGLEFYELKQFRDAIKFFKKATLLEPGMAKAHFGLALAYQESGDQRGLTEQYRILQRLDGALAKRLERSFPEFKIPCRGTIPFCN